MKHIIFLLVMLSTCSIAAYSQQKTAFGDEVGTLDGIIKAYYDVVTIKKGEKISYQRDSCLHVPNASVGMARHGKDGKVTLKLITLKQFHLMSDTALEKDGFSEREISRKVEHFGAIYHVWSTYESTITSAADGTIKGRGINSIELYFDGKRFWILSWIFDDESKETPIPEKYLKNE